MSRTAPFSFDLYRSVLHKIWSNDLTELYADNANVIYDRHSQEALNKHVNNRY